MVEYQKVGREIAGLAAAMRREKIKRSLRFLNLKRIKKNEEIAASNKKAEDTNKIVGDSFKAGNAALTAKNYEEAVKQYDVGLAADSEQAALPTWLPPCCQSAPL